MTARVRQSTLIVLVWAAVSGAVSHGQQPSPLPPPFPRTNATKLLENDRIVIWDVVWPSGQPTALHRHIYDQVGTYYARGGRTITSPEGVARQAMTEVGSLSTTRKGTTHVEMGNTDPPLRAVFIELKQDVPSGRGWRAEIGNAARPGVSQRSDDERVRVSDYTQSAGDFDYQAASDTVFVYLGEGRLRLSGDGGVQRELRVSPGTMRFVTQGTRERETALEGAPRAIAFEIK
jgi:hypothetical protein